MWDLFATCHGKSVLGRLIFQGQMHLVAMIPHRNAAADAVSFSNCDSHGLPPLISFFECYYYIYQWNDAYGWDKLWSSWLLIYHNCLYQLNIYLLARFVDRSRESKGLIWMVALYI